MAAVTRVTGQRWLSPRRDALVYVLAVALPIAIVAAVIGVLATDEPTWAIIGAVAVLAGGIIICDPMVIVSLAVPATLVLARIGGVLSVSDLVLAASTAVAIVMIRPRDLTAMQTLLWAGAAYAAASVPTLILNVYSENVIEWGHELVLVLGSMIVGFAIGRTGRTGLAIGSYVAGCLAIAFWAIGTFLIAYATTGQLIEVYLPNLHKNTIGGMLSAAIVMIYARPPWLRLNPVPYWTVLAILSAGVAVSQSRQAMIAAIAGLIVVSLRRRPETGRRPTFIWIAAAPVLIYALSMLASQLESDNRFNSAYQRLTWYGDSIDIWLTSPIFGVGLRWWYTSRFGDGFQPPNAELEVLTSVGIVGLLAFLALFIVAFFALWRLDPVYGTVGAAVVITRLTQSQFDLYWVAGQASLLWIVAGISYGALCHHRDSSYALPPEPVVGHVLRPAVGGARHRRAEAE
ncbi:O-antigen ligase [Microbacterium sp. MPKO10]|uniref:O-antigen ligase family protein n=1 Tax=Microbacterium sp. MPKO10 TaxID=2989818 RepID=UPI00223589DD|nr:O-antigen ligase family protein [Microbacterium sp. MPKO10]MCW4458870.1 O-antigen ligase family protein [Microbacterium sp. MPKO10]